MRTARSLTVSCSIRLGGVPNPPPMQTPQMQTPPDVDFP